MRRVSQKPPNRIYLPLSLTDRERPEAPDGLNVGRSHIELGYSHGYMRKEVMLFSVPLLFAIQVKSFIVGPVGRLYRHCMASTFHPKANLPPPSAHIFSQQIHKVSTTTPAPTTAPHAAGSATSSPRGEQPPGIVNISWLSHASFWTTHLLLSPLILVYSFIYYNNPNDLSFRKTSLSMRFKRQSTGNLRLSAPA